MGGHGSGHNQYSALGSLCGAVDELGPGRAAISRAHTDRESSSAAYAPWRKRRGRDQTRCRMPLTRAREAIWDMARLLAPRPGQFELASRLALICALTLLVTEIYQTPEPALTTYVAFFLNRDSRTM